VPVADGLPGAVGAGDGLPVAGTQLEGERVLLVLELLEAARQRYPEPHVERVPDEAVGEIEEEGD